MSVRNAGVTSVKGLDRLRMKGRRKGQYRHEWWIAHGLDVGNLERRCGVCRWRIGVVVERIGDWPRL